MRFLSLSGAALIAATLAGPVAAQTTYNVSTVAELNAAVADVNSGDGGDLIVLAPGTYALTQGLGFYRVVTIVGDPVLPTVLDGNGQPFILGFGSGPATIANLTLRNAPTGIAYGVTSGDLEASGITVTGCDVGYTSADGDGAAYFSNSTFTGSATHALETDCADIHLRNVTVSNSAVGLWVHQSCSLHTQIEVTNSLLVANAQDCDLGGIFAALGDASFDSDGSCAANWFAPGLSTTSVSALGLGALADNGGPTPTESIPDTSTAVNAGDDATCAGVDQRGLVRGDGSCDIGAYEYGASVVANTEPGLNVTVTPAPGVSLTFYAVNATGNTTAATVGGPPPPSGFQVDGVVYDISTTAEYYGWVLVCLPYDPDVDPTPLLFHYEDVPPPDWVDRTASVDPVGRTVCGAVPSLSPFAVMMPVQQGSGAGAVADTLTIAPAGGGDLTLSWGASCTATDDDYAVYEGTIGSWYSHVSRLCSTGGATTATLTPSPGDTYYLVVPRSGSVEGAYGEDSSGSPIPQGGNACAAQVIAACP